MSLEKSGIDQITDPIKDTLLYVPKETLRAGKELATEAPRKAFKTILGISWKIARLPLIALMNLPLLPSPKSADGSQGMMTFGEARYKVRDITALSRQGKLFDSASIKSVLNADNEDQTANAA